MREIKFREWDQNRHEIYGGDIPGMSYGNREDFDDMVGFRFAHTELMDYEGTEEFQNKRILEQFTGLHDKNGKEIYEGDIVEFPSKRGTINFMGIVVYEKFCFNIKGFYEVFYDYPSLAFSEGNNYEVIGNIHENPELLEDVDDQYDWNLFVGAVCGRFYGIGRKHFMGVYLFDV